jgi:hypothetical protein
MRKGYLIFTTHDGDELDATFIEDKEFFERLTSDEVQDNEGAFRLWVEYQGAHEEVYKTKNRYFAQAPGNYEWPFSDVTVLGTYYLLVY